MKPSNQPINTYHRYHIETRPTADIAAWPNRFLVNVRKAGLAKLLLEEIIHQRGDMKAVISRPCLYGTFSGPIGGFAPRPQYCVGCLRCTIQHPDMVQILPNPARQQLGDSYFHFKHVNSVAYESDTGNIPVKGAGYRGKFGGEGWDGMWTDMSEIVRPTRDGIHGREFISTQVDLGEKPPYLVFDSLGLPAGGETRLISLPVPFIFGEAPASVASPLLDEIHVRAASEINTLAILPLSRVLSHGKFPENIVLLMKPDDIDRISSLPFTPKMIEIDPGLATVASLEKPIDRIRSRFPETILTMRLEHTEDQVLNALFQLGLRVFHLAADYHGRNLEGEFILDWIRQVHLTFVNAGVRDQVSLITSGGIVAAEHVPKAIICGADTVAIDTPLLVALQARFQGECADRPSSKFTLPDGISLEWGVQRLKNLAAAWHSQLLEILGAMGLREVRRLRGEIGRAMFQTDLEREAFAEIDGYDD